MVNTGVSAGCQDFKYPTQCTRGGRIIQSNQVQAIKSGSINQITLNQCVCVCVCGVVCGVWCVVCGVWCVVCVCVCVWTWMTSMVINMNKSGMKHAMHGLE